MTMGMAIGQRVKLTQYAFDNGVCEDSKANRAMRGTSVPPAPKTSAFGRQTPRQ